ncbi:Hypothetical predicted protein [Mytilus galloprovincialis]|uniref:L1 transposable element RRM domain-containing protein n=1 Tax=Mytilus galloprovincialis TaxID=29158 RepID=A0A8B6EXX8_MYTGA|nr:Hypothetical predicted protein [Mytilus galloprovincialis]
MEEENVNTSQMLNTSRDVLYGQPEQSVTLDNVYQLMLGINERLTTIEKGMSQVNQMNRTLTNLVTKFTEINSKVAEAEGQIKNFKSRCDSNDGKMSQIKHDHTELNKEVKNLKKIQTDANNNLQGISDFMDDFKVNHENNVKDVKSAKSSISKVANDLADNTLELRNEIKAVVKNAKQENEILQSTVIDLQCRSMKNNLVFTGLTETEGENTEEVIRTFIQQFLHITHRIEFGNVHRFGYGAKPGRRGRPRPIVARFLYYKDLARSLSNTYRLKGKPFGVNQQFPEIIEQARKSLYPVMKQKRIEGHTVKLVRDILYVDGEMYNDQISDIEPTDSLASQMRTPDHHQNRKRRRRISSTPNPDS